MYLNRDIQYNYVFVSVLDGMLLYKANMKEEKKRDNSCIITQNEISSGLAAKGATGSVSFKKREDIWKQSSDHVSHPLRPIIQFLLNHATLSSPSFQSYSAINCVETN